MGNITWDKENGLHYANSKELRAEASKLARKSKSTVEWRDTAKRMRLAQKAKKLMRLARFTERDEDE